MAVNLSSLGRRVRSFYDDSISPVLKTEKEKLLDQTQGVRAKARGAYDDAAEKAKAKLDEELIPKTNQITKDSTAITKTIGTKIPEILSANF